jgi:hypothetical protein
MPPADFSLTIPPLTRLIDNMKPSFLPTEDDMSLLRLVVLSDVSIKDPLMLVRADMTTVVVGTGFSSVTKAGNTYPTFPDMRLIASEKDRLNAWILTDESIDVSLFEYILPTLDFPPLYATRDIIAKFRNNITRPEFLEKCRFFELFPPGTESRRIGDIEILISSNESGSGLVFKNSGTGFVDYLHPQGTAVRTSELPILKKQQEKCFIDTDEVVSGEILLFRGKKREKHQLKYTFDTFFVDKSSIGVLAGYTLSDREQLSENGVLIFTLEEDTRARTIKGHIFIDSRGFVHSHEMMAVHKEILKGIRATYEKCLLQNERIERAELVQQLRREITKYCFLLTGRTPVVMPVITDRA